MKRRYRAEREFGLIVGGILILLSGWWLYRGKFLDAAYIMLAVGAAASDFAGLLFPRALVYPNKAWMLLAEGLSFITTRIILGMVFFRDHHANWSDKRLMGWDPLSRRGARRRLLLAHLFRAATRPAPLRKNVLGVSNVESTSRERAVGVYAAKQEVLAGADRDHVGVGRGFACACQGFCHCAVYLYIVLGLEGVYLITVLGISAFYHDSAACLVVDGEIIAAAQEERFTRIKHDHNFPLHAVRYCLSEANLKPSDLDYVGFYDKPLLKFDRLLETYLDYAPSGFSSFLKALPLWMREKLWMPDLIRTEMAKAGAKTMNALRRNWEKSLSGNCSLAIITKATQPVPSTLRLLKKPRS